MEINKGPDLGAKDERDSELKHNLVRNVFDISENKKLHIVRNDNDTKNK